jgi:ADP-ribose pyrophosphatase
MAGKKTAIKKATKAPVAKAEALSPARAVKAKKTASPTKQGNPGRAKNAVSGRPVPAKANKDSVNAVTKAKARPKPATKDPATLLDSEVVYQGPLFRVQRDHIIEPGGRDAIRDVIRHNGSVVILAVDPAKRKRDPWIVIERQYRHAAGQFLWELPAGKLDAGETPLEGAKRELSEETGYKANKWSPLVEYFASPGFLGESMKVFLAEGLIAGDAHPEEDEHIDFRLVKLSELLEMVEKGKIVDGKTLTAVLFYARLLGVKRKK